MPSGKRIFRLRANRERIGGEVTITIGHYPVIGPDAARELALGYLLDIARGIHPNKTKRAKRRKMLSLWSVFDDYEANNKRLKEITAKRYRASLNRNLTTWCDKPLQSITRQMILDRHAELTDRSPAEADGVFRILRALFNFAKEEYRGGDNEILFDENPVEILKHRKQWNNLKQKSTHIKKSDLPRWWTTIHSEWITAMETGEVYRASVTCSLLVASLTGLRKSEILSLEWKDIDLTNDVILIEKTKNGDGLELPISPYLKKVLLCQKGQVKAGFVFPSPGHGRVSEPKKVIADLSKLANVPFGYHDLRRTFATIANEAGVSAYTMKRLLNHRTQRSDVTSGYLCLTAEQLRDSSALVETCILEVARVKHG